MAMRGLWLENRQLSYRDDLPVPEPAAGEVLLRVLRAGICRTDLELLRGYQPFSGIPGHELVGRVEQGPPELLGTRQVCEINVGCGSCRLCRMGLPGHCSQRRVLGIRGLHGAFAECCVVPVANLHPVPEHLSSDAAVFAEPLAAALQIREQVTISGSHRVLVVGDGRLGLLVAQALSLSGCELLVLGRHEHKLRLLAGRGIPSTRDTAAVQQGSFDLAVECTGNPDGFGIALQALRPRGTLVLKSTYAEGRLPELPAARVVVDEISIIGSRCGPFAPALQLLAEGRVEVESLITARFPLADGLQAFAAAASPGALKVLLEIGENRSS